MNAPAIRKIIHIDMDAFYAAIEQRDNPQLRGMPVAVGHGAKRGVVAAASYEARAFGVRSAMPSTTAIRNCPDLIFVRPRFEVYRGVSQQIREIFEDFTPLIEPLSLDEAYLDVTANIQAIATASETAERIRARIFSQTGLTASAGISYNKFLAKLASDFRKPNGQFVVTPRTALAFIATLPVRKFHGVGPVTAKKMEALGLHTGADLRAQSLEFLKQHFGKSGAWYYAIARGDDDRRVSPDRERKSSGSETTFSEDRFDQTAIEAGVLEMADEVWSWCDQHKEFGRTVTVKIKYSDFRQITRSKTLPSPVITRADLHAISAALVCSTFPVEQGVRLVGVSVSNFSQPALTQPQLDLGLDFGGPSFKSGSQLSP